MEEGVEGGQGGGHGEVVGRVVLALYAVCVRSALLAYA